MQPFGKTYLISCEPTEKIEKVGSIFIVNEDSSINDIFWKGKVEGYGVGWAEEEKKDLIPIGTKIVMAYGKESPDKGGIKIQLKKGIYYVREPEAILGVIEE